MINNVCKKINLNHETWLKFDDRYNKPITNELIEIMKNYDKIMFGSKFNQNVDHLPDNITHIVFHSSFNQNVDFLPQSITYLEFIGTFNKNINNLPNKLTHLNLSEKFNRSIDNLPKHLIHLSIYDTFRQNVACLPKNLKNLKIYHKRHHICISNIDERIEKIQTDDEKNEIINRFIDKIPNNCRIYTHTY